MAKVGNKMVKVIQDIRETSVNVSREEKLLAFYFIFETSRRDH